MVIVISAHASMSNVQKFHLEPLRSAVGGCSPGVGLALLVQTGIVWMPSEGFDAPCAKGAGA